MNKDQWLTLSGIVVNVCLAITTIYLALYAREQWKEIKQQTPAVQAAAQMALLSMRPELQIDEIKIDPTVYYGKPLNSVAAREMQFGTHITIESVGQSTAFSASLDEQVHPFTGSDPREELKAACERVDRTTVSVDGPSTDLPKGKKPTWGGPGILRVENPVEFFGQFPTDKQGNRSVVIEFPVCLGYTSPIDKKRHHTATLSLIEFKISRADLQHLEEPRKNAGVNGTFHLAVNVEPFGLLDTFND
jgi:hypothetical protein